MLPTPGKHLVTHGYENEWLEPFIFSLVDINPHGIIELLPIVRWMPRSTHIGSRGTRELPNFNRYVFCWWVWYTCNTVDGCELHFAPGNQAFETTTLMLTLVGTDSENHTLSEPDGNHKQKKQPYVGECLMIPRNK